MGGRLCAHRDARSQAAGEQEIAEFKSSTLSFVFVPRNPKYGYGDEKEIIKEYINFIYPKKGKFFLSSAAKKKRKK